MESAKDAGIPVPLAFLQIIGSYGFQEKRRFVGKVVEKKADNVVVGEIQAKSGCLTLKLSLRLTRFRNTYLSSSGLRYCGGICLR
ncbi:hypothetical protein UP17_10220 [Peribacillus simplex]|nr:hypothetical protein UP17_10220 [Peribacillus simplex]